jgi:hypothetical protein
LLFAVADPLIYYSSEVKPYAADVAASVALVLAANVFVETVPRRASLVALAGGGCALLVFSFPATSVFAAIAITLIFAAILRKPRAPSAAIGTAVAIWLISSVAVAAFAASRLTQIRSNDDTRRFLGATGPDSVSRAVNVFGTNIAQGIGLLQSTPFNQLMKVALVCALIGAVSLLRRSSRWAFILLIPFGLTFLASAVHVYPLSVRTELFLTPAIILLLAEGVAQLVVWSHRQWRMPVAVTLVVAIAAGPFYLAATRLVHPRRVEEIRPVLEFVRDRWEAGDTLYLDSGAQYAFLYYEECNCLRLTHNGRKLWPVRPLSGVDFRAPAVDPTTPALVVVDNPRQYVADLRRVRRRGRVWILYSHVAKPSEELLVRRVLIGTLDKTGVRLTGIDRPRAHAYLYQLK